MTNESPIPAEALEVAQLAAGLTTAQRDAMAVEWCPNRIPSLTTAACRCALQRKGLVVNRMYEEALTPLGLAVRAHLLSTKESGNG